MQDKEFAGSKVAVTYIIAGIVITSTASFSSHLKLIRQASHVTMILQSAKSSVLKIFLCQKKKIFRLLQSADIHVNVSSQKISSPDQMDI